MDAIRMSDKRLVSIKRLKKADHPQEEEIIHYFSTGPHAKDPSNHSVPIYEVLQSPHVENIQFLVMPYLIRLHDVKFATVGEMVECIRQLFEVCPTTSNRIDVGRALIFVLLRDFASCTVIMSRIGECTSESSLMSYTLNNFVQ